MVQAIIETAIEANAIDEELRLNLEVLYYADSIQHRDAVRLLRHRSKELLNRKLNKLNELLSHCCELTPEEEQELLLLVGVPAVAAAS